MISPFGSLFKFLIFNLKRISFEEVIIKEKLIFFQKKEVYE